MVARSIQQLIEAATHITRDLFPLIHREGSQIEEAAGEHCNDWSEADKTAALILAATFCERTSRDLAYSAETSSDEQLLAEMFHYGYISMQIETHLGIAKVMDPEEQL